MSAPKSFKVVVIGDASVGKSSLIHRISDGEFWGCAPTIGCNFRKLIAKSTFGEDVSLEIWDTAGEERYQSVMSLYYRGANAIIVVYDVTDPKSFSNATLYWMEQIKIYCGNPLILLVGNKTDLVRGASEWTMSESSVQKWARDNGVTQFECSAKSEDGVSNFVTLLVDKLLECQQPVVSSGVNLEDSTVNGYYSYCRC